MNILGGSLTGTPTELNYVLNVTKVSDFVAQNKKNRAVRRLPTRQLMDVRSGLKLLNALMALTPLLCFLVRSFTATGTCLLEPVQGLNLKCR
jgi:hypothetical protein